MKNKLRLIVTAMLGLFMLTTGLKTFLSNTSCYAQEPDTAKIKKALPAKIGHVKGRNKKREPTVSKKSSEEMLNRLLEKEIASYSSDVPLALEFLKNPNPDRRLIALEGLGKARDPRAIEPIKKIIKNDSVATVRRDAVRSLAKISKYNNDFSIIPVFKEALNDYSVGVKLAAAQALIDLNDKVSPISTLLNIFKKEDNLFKESLEFWIQKEICRPDLPESTQYSIAKYAKSHNPEIALQMLIEIGNEEVITVLTNCLNSNNNWIQQKAQEAIKKIKNKQTKNKL